MTKYVIRTTTSPISGKHHVLLVVGRSIHRRATKFSSVRNLFFLRHLLLCGGNRPRSKHFHRIGRQLSPKPSPKASLSVRAAPVLTLTD